MTIPKKPTLQMRRQARLLGLIAQAAAEGWTELDLCDSRITALPPEIGQLTNLTYLDLYENRLTALPPEIGRLTALQYLGLTENRLTALPPEIEQLTATVELYGNPGFPDARPPDV